MTLNMPRRVVAKRERSKAEFTFSSVFTVLSESSLSLFSHSKIYTSRWLKQTKVLPQALENGSQ